MERLHKYRFFIAFYLLMGFLIPAYSSTQNRNHQAQRLQIVNQSLIQAQQKLLKLNDDKSLTIQQKEAETVSQKAIIEDLKKQLQSRTETKVAIVVRTGYGGQFSGPIVFGNSYQWGQCVWFVASRIRVPDDLGNANTWAARAAGHGYLVTSVPRVGSVAQTSAGWYGHVGIVVSISNAQVELDEMNVYGLGVEDHRWVDVGSYRYIYF